MSALFRAAAAVIASLVLGAAAVHGGRVLAANGVVFTAPQADAITAAPSAQETGAQETGALEAGALLAAFAEGRGARTARLDAVEQACGEAFVLRRGGVAGVEHVIAFLALPAGAGESVEIRRLSAPGDLIGVQAGRGSVSLTSPDGFEGLAWTLAETTAPAPKPAPLGPVEADALTLPCADPATAAARFHQRSGGTPTGAR